MQINNKIEDAHRNLNIAQNIKYFKLNQYKIPFYWDTTDFNYSNKTIFAVH